jgi:hypothetical protein
LGDSKKKKTSGHPASKELSCPPPLSLYVTVYSAAVRERVLKVFFLRKHMYIAVKTGSYSENLNSIIWNRYHGFESPSGGR